MRGKLAILLLCLFFASNIALGYFVFAPCLHYVLWIKAAEMQLGFVFVFFGVISLWALEVYLLLRK
jgi:hypothetical protein